MTISSSLVALSAALATANAAFQGFNYGAAFTNGAVKQQSDFEQEFETAQGLEGTDGAFNSARLYTMVQGGSPNDPISAIPAAIKTRTTLLFGLWASAGDDAFDAEIEALQKTIDQYCDQLDGLVAGISVGSEDLYRNSPTGIANGEFAGANPDTLVRYIGLTRDAVRGSCLSDAPIGHVDTWTAFDNSSNSAVIDAVDFLGMNAFAYFEDTQPNGIENGASLFEEALGRTRAAAGGKDIWITETGWPVSGDNFGEAVASTDNAETFWKDVGCPRFGNVNVFWYTLKDAAPDTPSPSFGVIGSEWTTKPLYDLTCDASSDPDTTTTTSTASESKTQDPEPEPTDDDDGDDDDDDAPSTSSGPVVDPTSFWEPEPEPTQSGPIVDPTSFWEPEPEPEPTESGPIVDPTSFWEPEPEPTNTPPTEPIPTPEEPIPEPSGTDDGSEQPTETPGSGSGKLNPLGAGVAAVALAVALF